LRTRLNPTIGFLRLLLDDLVDNPQERRELIEESYKSTMRVSNVIDVLEDIIKLQSRFKLGLLDESQGHENLKRIVEKFNNYVSPMLYSLRSLSDSAGVSLVDHLGENPPEQNELIKKAWNAAIHLLDTTQELEDSVKLLTAPKNTLNGKELQPQISNL
jgi:ATP-binding cassette, subfamily B, bacterial MsbA